MNTYTIYQCSICRRKKDVLRDDRRAIPNLCTITKGCAGRLFSIGETTSASSTPAVSGLTDWYPRGKTQQSFETVSEPSQVKLSTSPTGSLTVAVKIGSTALPLSLQLDLTQRKTEDIRYQQYIFNTTTPTLVFSGRDSQGNNLRFDTSAIYEGRVFVIVNGIPKFNGDDLTLTPNTVTFPSPVPVGSVVSVGVYVERNTVSRSLNFVKNDSASIGDGAWSNVRYVTFPPSADLWYLYTCSDLGDITSSSRARVDGISPSIAGISLDSVRFLLSDPPFGYVDRLLSFAVPAETLNEGYLLTASADLITELYVDSSVVSELYPPVRLKPDSPNSSFISPDSYAGQDVTSEIVPALSSSKIIGPV